MFALQSVTPTRLRARIPMIGEVESRRLLSALHRHDRFPESRAGVRLSTIRHLQTLSYLPTLKCLTVQQSALDPFVKYALGTTDGHTIETVRIPLEVAGRYSVCVSSQVGCALACRFCATGFMGLRRNLESWEIVEQVREIRRGLDPSKRERVHGVVFQGMGEPLANLDSVIEAIGVMTDPSLLAIDARSITVCTAGIPDGIRRMARELPKVRLGVSLGSAIPATRSRLMPVDRAYPLEEVLDAAADHARRSSYAPMWALTLLSGVNDSDADARALLELAAGFTAKTGVRPRISIIAYNAITPDSTNIFERSSATREAAFRAVLHEAGIPTHRRYSGGGDVAAACGQLGANISRIQREPDK